MAKRRNWHPGSGTEHVPICALHFRVTDFQNHMQWSMGFATHLKLLPTAVPSLQTVDVGERHRKVLRRPGWEPRVIRREADERGSTGNTFEAD